MCVCWGGDRDGSRTAHWDSKAHEAWAHHFSAAQASLELKYVSFVKSWKNPDLTTFIKF